jgi:hypothetical protein
MVSWRPRVSSDMDTRITIGTGSGLWRLDGDSATALETFAGRAVTAVTVDGATTWALVGGNSLWRERDGVWAEHAAIEGAPATCLAPSADGLLIGTEQAHLGRLDGARVRRVDAFEAVDGRRDWYTPWGDPAAVRSIAVAREGVIYVNVHVGGVVRSRDGGASWAPTVDIEQDVHQVLTHPTRPNIVLAASAEGFGISRDGGETWTFETAGLHAHYLRAVAVAGDHVLISAATGFRGRRSAIYRRRLDDDTRFERCRAGLPEWFDDNVDTACLAADGALAVLGTADGRVYRSVDAGASWVLALKGLPAISGVALG